MNKIHWFILLFFLIADHCLGQITFQKVIHARYACQANAVQQTNDSGYIIAGTITDSTDLYNELYIIKTNKYGDTLWTKTFGGFPDYDNDGFSIMQTKDSGYIVVGNITDTSAAPRNIYLIKTNSFGDTLWTKSYGQDGGQNGYFVKQTNDGGYIITGKTFSLGGATSYDVYLLKLNASGDIIWNKTYGGSAYDFGSQVEQTSDSGYIICGQTESFGVNSVYLIKTNSNGDTLWTRTYGGTNLDIGNAVRQTNDGGYIIAGYTTSFGISYGNAYVIKTKSNGDTSWTKIYTADGGSSASDIQQTNDGGYIITGSADGFGGTSSYTYLIKTDVNGDTLWTKVYGGINYDGGSSVSQTYDGGYIIAGRSNPHDTIPPRFYINLIKTDGDGNTGCNQSKTTTTVSSTNTLVGRPQTIVSSGGTASGAYTTVGSGGIVSTLCFSDGINELNKNNSIYLYPNPATDKLYFKNYISKAGSVVTIFNVLGETMHVEKVDLSNEKGININELSIGIYFIQLTSESEIYIG